MQDRSLATINNILKTAKTLFTHKQYADVSLKEIAQEAGITKGALYHHFSTKEDLYLKMMLRYLGDLKEATSASVEATRGRPCQQRLHHSLTGFLQLPAETIAVIGLVRRDSNIFQPEVRRQLIDAYQSALPNLLQTIFGEAMANDEIVQTDARLLAWQYIAIVEASNNDYGRRALGSTEALAEFVANSFFNGIHTKINTDMNDKEKDERYNKDLTH